MIGAASKRLAVREWIPRTTTRTHICRARDVPRRVLSACILVSGRLVVSHYVGALLTAFAAIAKQKSGRPAVLSPTRNHTDSRHPSLRLLRYPHESPVISSIGRERLAGGRAPTEGLDISVPSNSLDGNLFHHPPASSQPGTGLSPINADDISGWDESHLMSGPSLSTMQGPRDSHQHMSPEHEMASQSSGAPSGHDDDSPEAWTARLAALATWTTQTAKNLAPSDINTPLTVSSPQVDQVFDGTNTLLHILDSISGSSVRDLPLP